MKTLEELKKTHWRELTQEDLAYLKEKGITNGCGGAGDRWYHKLIRRFLLWILSILRAVFVEASCMIHDFRYWQGGTKSRRKEDDQGFFFAILADIQNYIKDPFPFVGYTLLALVFYGAVRSLGWVYYNYHE